MKQYIDDKIKELQSQLDLFINTPSKGGSEVGNKDLKAIQDLIKRLSQLEISFKEFVNKARIDDLWNEIDKLKTNKADISYVDDKYNDLLNQINNILNKINELNEKDNEQQEEIDDLRKKLDDIYTLVQTLQNQLNNFHPITHDTEIGKPNIDLSQYVSLILFNDYKKENNEKFSKIFAELDKLKKLIDELFELLKNKADLNDLEDLKNFLLQKIDELAIACNKKFADKNETAKNFRYLEQQIKKILAMLLNKKDDHGDNWLLAKKPLNGFTCASCEAYIGELKDNGQYIPWNRYPLRDPNEKLYRIGNGFSKMLQMLNFDNVMIVIIVIIKEDFKVLIIGIKMLIIYNRIVIFKGLILLRKIVKLIIMLIRIIYLRLRRKILMMDLILLLVMQGMKMMVLKLY